MKSYNIAVIVACIDEGYQNSIITGIQSFASKNCINAAVFASFSGVMGSQRHDTGELNIFQLPDFRMFDGAVLLTNTIAYQPVINDILEKIKEAGIPAVSIDNNIPEFYHIGIDNSKAMREIAEHFIHEHNCRTFNYVSGPKENPESNARLKSFLQVLEENNITIEQERIFYGDFRSPSGRDAVNSFLNSGLSIPQAIICANDVMALSVIIALNAHGIKVPDDVAVSGFDNIASARNYPTELTSVERPLKRSGELACQILLNHFNGTKQERSIILDMHPNFTESCGCFDGMTVHKDIKSFKRLNFNNFAKFENASEYLSLINRMSCHLVECDSIDDFIHSLRAYISEIKAEEFFLCLCNDWCAGNSSDGLTSEEYTINGYTKLMTVPMAYINGQFTSLPDFDSSCILPNMFRHTGESRFYYFIPLHFRERCLGYMVIMNSPFPLESSMFQTWCVTISNMLENIRKIICLDHAVHKLNKLYAMDTLSGIYNRNGFVKGTSLPFSYCISHKLPVMLMFIDMDELKHINDTYGHSAGDEAIHNIAAAIDKACCNGEVYCRFGGDEFIVFAAEYSEADAQALTDRVNDCIAEINRRSSSEYTLSASIGYYITVPKEGDDIFNLVTIADNVMYNSKKKRKLSKYLKSNNSEHNDKK